MTYATNKRKPPSGVGRWFARAPRYFYRIGLGRILGRRFVLIEHVGRRSGLARQTVLEVIQREPEALYVAAAWGTRSDWFKNISANSTVRISSGNLQNVKSEATVLDRQSAVTIFERYAIEHATAARGLAKAFKLPFNDPEAMATAVPIVRLSIDNGP
ncbi:MAG: nitroreductase family deazaflavin-dependent oxidoreductase [Acidimicrobiia bacterium]|nr:nitroreductase family deazaflavin-dependent oxidoreductase [Acidimicrobiia bacterium]